MMDRGGSAKALGDAPEFIDPSDTDDEDDFVDDAFDGPPGEEGKGDTGGNMDKQVAKEECIQAVSSDFDDDVWSDKMVEGAQENVSVPRGGQSRYNLRPRNGPV